MNSDQNKKLVQLVLSLMAMYSEKKAAFLRATEAVDSGASYEDAAAELRGMAS